MTRPDWNLTMVKAREALALLPRLPETDDRIVWREVEVAHVDTGCTRHPVFGPWSGDHTEVLRVEDGLNLMERYWPTRPRGILGIEALPRAPLPAKSALAYEARKAVDQLF